ncbi:hypothetical protein N007_12365 [Alicyclobacillus acidoterrestris ATCC 49025]|nr:hypothetical protein N007_12365 [Alicyclobacillus acidoterrestris ATCC 49025]
MPLEDAQTYKFDPFDVTKVWHYEDYPLIPVGRMVLNRNPENYFAEVEQVAMSPANIVPGIGFSPDKMLQGRLFAYADAHRYRIGTNYNLLPVNRPHATTAQNYQRDGAMRFDNNGGGSVNYEPNSFHGPTQSEPAKGYLLPVSGVAAEHAYPSDDHYTQAGDLYRLLSSEDKAHLIDNIVHAMQGVEESIQRRQIEHFTKADPDYGARVAAGLGLSTNVNS